MRSIGRRPGQKEDRWEHLLGDDDGAVDLASAEPYRESTPAPSAATRRARPAMSAASGSDEGRIAALEAQVRALRDELDALRRTLRRADRLTCR